jgi:DNA-binding GntR family transcriptional regulator
MMTTASLRIADLAIDAGTHGPQTNYQRVRDALREDIVLGHFRGDERLVMNLLCERYRVSTPPIREALNHLQVSGLVVIEANRGARVRAISPEFIGEVFEIRVAMETALLERAVPLFTAHDSARLEAAAVDFETAVASGSVPAMALMNRGFHHSIYEVRINHEAMRLLRQHSAVITTMRNRYGFGAGRTDRVIADHREILAACTARDVARASALLRSHIERSAADLLDRMTAGGA